MTQGLWFDNQTVTRAIDFIQSLTLTKSTSSGRPEPFVLLPHHKKLVANLLGWRRADGTRVYRKCFHSVARKNAKTQLAAALGLYLLLMDGEMSPEIYIAAKDRDQASICYRAARDMVYADEGLAAMVKVTDHVKMIEYPKNNGVLRALSSEGKSKHGYNPSGLIFDELHAWGESERELYDALTTGSGARKQPLQIVITTAGHDLESLCGHEYLYAKRVENGDVQDPTYLPLIYELAADDDWTDERNWPKANPALDSIINRQSLREDCEKAIKRPAEQNKFRRLYMNQWTEASEVWIPSAEWDRCQVPADEWPNLTGKLCVGAFDLSMTSDLTAFTAIWPENGEYWLKTYFFIPADNIRARSIRDNVRYDVWAQQGWIELTPGEVVDYGYLVHRVVDIARKHQLSRVAYDRWGAEPVRQALEDEGIEVVKFGQGFASMSAPAQQLENAVFGRKIRHDGNPVMRWNLSCCAKSEDPGQRIKPIKAKGSSTARIDGVVATVMAIGVVPAESMEPPRLWVV